MPSLFGVTHEVTALPFQFNAHADAVISAFPCLLHAEMLQPFLLYDLADAALQVSDVRTHLAQHHQSSSRCMHV